jgi:hypothetical protein
MPSRDPWVLKKENIYSLFLALITWRIVPHISPDPWTYITWSIPSYLIPGLVKKYFSADHRTFLI